MRFGGFGITGVGSQAIPLERRCEKCGELLDQKNECVGPCARPTVKKPRGATKAQLEYRERLFGVVSGGATRGQLFSAVQRQIADYEADIYKAGRDARVAKKGGLR